MNKDTIFNEAKDWLKYLTAAFFIALLINRFILINADVPSGSMEKTIMTEDRLFAFRLAYVFSEPERGDIIVFRFPDNEKLSI